MYGLSMQTIHISIGWMLILKEEQSIVQNYENLLLCTENDKMRKNNWNNYIIEFTTFENGSYYLLMCANCNRRKKGCQQDSHIAYLHFYLDRLELSISTLERLEKQLLVFCFSGREFQESSV